MEVKAGYKLTEVGVIPEDWQAPQVGEVCGFIVPGRNKPKLFDGDIPWITTPDLEEGKTVRVSRLGLCISRKEAKSVGSKIVPSGSVLMSCAGELGIVALTQNEVVVNQQLHVFIPTERTDRTFLLNALAYRKDQIASYGTKTAVPYLNKSSCNSIQVPLPPLPEQRSIATVLSDMDALLGTLDQLIAKKRDLKQATMQQLLTGKKRLPGFSEGKWVMRRQKEVCSYINGRAYQRTEWETDGTPVVRLQNLTGSGDKYYYSHLKLPEHQYMDNGDLIFMWSASFGPYIWKGGKAIYHYHIWKIDCDLEKVDQVFYYYKLAELTENIKKGSNGSTMAHVTKGEMENFSITLPEDAEEQRAISSVLSDIDTELAALEQRRDKTRALKQGMMQELLTGRTRLR